jgi:hypothetical protein
VYLSSYLGKKRKRNFFSFLSFIVKNRLKFCVQVRSEREREKKISAKDTITLEFLLGE